jgi:hypothetical protein
MNVLRSYEILYKTKKIQSQTKQEKKELAQKSARENSGILPPIWVQSHRYAYRFALFTLLQAHSIHGKPLWEHRKRSSW